MRGALAMIVAVAASSAGCVAVDPFACAGDADCGPGGVCEAVGYCSFDDAACDSGRRYGEHAGDGLAAACVGEEQSTDVGDVIGLALGSDHSCAWTSEGAVWCWGRNDAGAIGREGGDAPIPMRVADVDAMTLAAGEHHTCAVTTAGEVSCWGDNDDGQLGDGTRNARARPAAAAGFGDAAAVAAGEQHTCGRTGAGRVSCWGRNRDGELARNGNGGSTTPVTIPVGQVAGVAAGGQHACVVDGDGGVRCWGKDDSGQLGIGGGDNLRAAVRVPVEVPGFAGASSLSLGGEHTCALVGDRVRCAGSNGSGQLGDGTGADSNVPVDVAGLDGVVEIASGDWFTCARTADGAVRCWGMGDDGELGDGTVGDRAAPGAPVALAAPAVAIAAGERHACALAGDGCVSCWGSNEYGQLGVNAGSGTAVPVAIERFCAE